MCNCDGADFPVPGAPGLQSDGNDVEDGCQITHVPRDDNRRIGHTAQPCATWLAHAWLNMQSVVMPKGHKPCTCRGVVASMIGVNSGSVS